MDIRNHYNEEIAECIEYHARHIDDMPVHVREVLLQRIEFLHDLVDEYQQ